MAWTKAKTAIVAGVAVIVATGMTTLVVNQFHPFWIQDGLWDDIEKLDLASLPPAFVLRPTHFANESKPIGRYYVNAKFIFPTGKMIGKDFDLQHLIQAAYDSNGLKFGSWTRMVFPHDMPQDRFDFLDTVSNPEERLQAQIAKQLGFTARVEARKTNVLFLKIVNPALFDATTIQGTSLTSLNQSEPLPQIARIWENVLRIPIIDQTDSSNHWVSPSFLPDEGLTAFNETLRRKYGLELVPGSGTVDFLAVGRVE